MVNPYADDYGTPDEPAANVLIWHRPYSAPQEAIGLFTMEEALIFLGKNDKALSDSSEDHDWAGEMEWQLDQKGEFDTPGFHIEFDE